MITHNYDLDVVPSGGRRLEIWLNQYDEDFQLVFALKARTGTFVVESGTTAAIRGTKPDGNGYSADAAIDTESATVTVTGDQQMTVAAGRSNYEITLYKDGKELNSANFTICVERAALDKDTPTSRSQTRELVAIEDNAEEIIGAAEQAYAVKQEIEQLAAQVAGNASSATAVANEALSKSTNAENNAAESVTGVETLQRNVTAMRLAVEGKVDGAYIENGYLYLTGNNEVVAGPLGPFSGGGGGGGGGGNNAVMSVANATGWLSTTIADGDACPVSFTWSSVEDDTPTGDGTVKVTVGGAVKAIMNVRQGTATIDISPYLTTGSNLVKVTVSDIYDNSRTINFSVNCVAISISSTFDSSVPYQGTISFPYTPNGNVAKTIKFAVDGTVIDTVSTSISGRQMSFIIPQQSHGAHVFECWYECEINGQTVYSNRLRYELICIASGDTRPIIVSPFNLQTAAQYTTLNIPYTVYDPAHITADVAINVGAETAAELTVDRTQHVFSYRADNVGQLVITISSGSAAKTIALTITESDVNVEAETNQLVLHLSSAGRSNSEAHPEVWTDAGNSVAAALTGFNFTSDGWQLDSDGATVLRVAGDARVTVPYQAFAVDFRGTGKTIEVEFATRDVMDYDATILSCMSGGRGFSLTAQLARLASEQSEISMQYKENEHVRVSFVVEKRSQNRLIYIYVNGIASGVVQYPDSDDFAQSTPVGISIGSNDCTVDIYRIRIYDNNLSRSQILNNWIADTQNVTLMLERFRRNNIYDAYGNIVIAKLPNDLPYMVIECIELPQYKGDKKTVAITYVDPVTPAKSFTANGVQADVQGTSSQYYARKNYKLKFKNGFVLENGTETPKYALRNGAIPTNTFCMKADVASSEGANNVELARLYDEACPFKTPPQEDNEAVRQGIDGFPIVIFWNDGESTTFLGKYNFNNDKSTEDVFGLSAGDESWEIKNNTSDRVLWKSDDYSGDGWLNDFEARYPDTDPAYENPVKLAALASWLKSTDQTAATGNALVQPYTDTDGITHTVDNAAYRLAKFKTEAADHLEMASTIFYYIFTELFLMVDSRAKNAFPTWIAGGKCCWLPYDFDTALGINNEGSLVFSYNLEDTDTVSGGADVFNGQQSVLWINLRQAFFSQIRSMYQTLRSNGDLSYAKVERMFEEHQAKWGEAVFNEDAWFKYLQPLIEDGSGAYLSMLQGSKAEQRKWWLYNRFRYIDSKYNAGDSLSDIIQLRGYAKANISVTPYADIYASVKYGSYLVQTRAERGQPHELVCPLDSVNDTEIYIYSASQLSDVGDLSGLKVGFADFSMATKLQAIKVGDSSVQYSNGNLTELYLGNNVLLRTLDVRNCSGLGTGDMKTVDISGCANIEHVYFDGTAVTGVSLPNGGILKTLQLPSTITNLTLRNQPGITTFVMPSYAAISTLWVENPSAAVNTKAIIQAIPASSRVRIIGIAWECEDATEIGSLYDILDAMRGLDEYGNNMDTAQVSGTIHISSATGAEMAALEGRYPNVTINVDHVLSYLTYMNYNGTSTLKTVSCIDGVPQESGPSNPSRSSTAQYSYTFAGWSLSQNSSTADANAERNVLANRTIYAAYTQTTRTYTVTWRNSDNTVLETDTNVPYGATPQYNGSTPQNPTSGGGSFQGWTPAVQTVTGDATYTASYIVTYTVYFYNGQTLLQTVTGVQAGGSAAYTGATPTDPVNGYDFDGWLPQPTNIHANTSCYAQFREPSAVREITDDWATIVSKIAAGTANYQVGNYKPLDLGSEGVVRMQIVAKGANASPLASGSGNAAYDWVSMDLLAADHSMNTSHTNSGGWEVSAMRTYMKDTIKPLIPQTVRDAIKNVTKYSYSYSPSNANAATTDDVWIPSYREIFGGSGVETQGPDYTGIYSDANARKKAKAGASSTVGWWLRSAYSGPSSFFWYVFSDGAASDYSAGYSRALPLGFSL